MTHAILGLRLECFRGACIPVDIEFDKRRPSVLIFGENGTGKSTIADAIDFVANKSIGSLQHRSLDGAARIDYLKSMGSATSDVSVQLSTAQGQWTGSIKGREVIRSGPADAPVVRVLRRPGLNKLMEAQPQDRYAELRRFVGADEAEAAEQHLDTLVKQWNAEFDSAARVVQQSIDRLKGLAEEAGSASADPVEWAQGEQSQQIEEIKSALSDLKIASGVANRVKAVMATVTEAGERARTARSAVLVAERKIAESDQAADGADELVPLLQQAEKYVSAHPKDACPVCEQDVNHAELKGKLAERIGAVQGLVALLRDRAKCVTALQAATTAQSSAQADLKAAIDAFRQNAICGATLAEDAQAVFENEADWESNQTTIIAAVGAAIESFSAKQAELDGVVNRRDRLERAQKDYLDNRAGAERTQRLRDRAKAVHEVLREERVAHSTGILNQIGDEVDRLYEMIHPGEGLGGCRLSLVKRASIEQKAQFGGEEVAPGAYYSESHLDTLGFCIWVAVAKLEQPEQAVVVLDDIFTSVDLEHLGRIATVIDDMVGTFAQVIVVTHSRRWLDHYRYSQGGGSGMDLKQLLGYAPATGVRLVGTKLPVQLLSDRLAEEPMDRQSVAGMAGVILEAVLDRLCLQYRRPVPRTADMKWTLGEYLDAIKEKHLNKLFLEYAPPEGKEAPTKPKPVDAAKPLLEETGPMREIRNKVGSHFNLDGAEIADKDVKRFGECVRDLADSLCCPWCQSIPEKRETDGYVCGCKATRLKPLSL